jgi:NADH:ubiquinone oxidoreductase subunit F (NADH-binding)
LNAKKIDWNLFNDVLENLSQTSFCGLGASAPTAFKTYITNVLNGKLPQ